MPLYVLNRNYTLATLKGHRIVFHKDQPVYVPPPVVPDAVAVGATPADGSEPDLGAAPDPVPGAELSPTDRENKILDAIRTLVARNERDDFNGAGQPKEGPLSAITGLKVDTKERNAVLQKYHELEFGPQ